MIRILIVDDHEVVRQGLRFALHQEPDLTVVDECADGATALDRIARLRPDVVLLDMVMPGLDGLAVLHALRDRHDPAAVVVLTSYPAEDRAMDAVRAGAVSYLSKSAAAPPRQGAAGRQAVEQRPVVVDRNRRDGARGRVRWQRARPRRGGAAGPRRPRG